MTDIVFQISPAVTNDQLNALFATAWANHVATHFQPILRHSLLYVCAYHDGVLIGFVNLAWDGGIHAFLLDTTVHIAFQRRGIGEQLIKTAVDAARQRDIEWVHVDYEPHLRSYYAKCGFLPTEAGLINLK
ncbi:MAG: GNAT family N-acetyltransferase [Chloroflexota bacterium]|nr:GNAT family N-acetyltransferase [Chloroflexota bacterium]